MRVVVIEAPEPIATPADVPGKHAGDDAQVKALIAAAQAGIDGPTGYLNRALGVQTIEIATSCWPQRLPYRPILELVSVEVDGEVVEGVTVSPDGRLTAPAGGPDGQTVIRYRAGYNGTENGPVPTSAKAAVVLIVVDLMAGHAEHGGLRSIDVDGGFSEAYNSPDQAQRGRTTTIAGLLAPLRVFS